MSKPDLAVVPPPEDEPENKGGGGTVATLPPQRALVPRTPVQLAYQTFMSSRQKELVEGGMEPGAARKKANEEWKAGRNQPEPPIKAEAQPPAPPPPAPAPPPPAPAPPPPARPAPPMQARAPQRAVAPPARPAPAPARPPAASDAGTERPPAEPAAERGAARGLRLQSLSADDRRELAQKARAEQRRREEADDRKAAAARRARGEESVMLLDEASRALGALAARRGLLFRIDINPGDVDAPLVVRVGELDEKGKTVWLFEAKADSIGGLGQVVVGILRKMRKAEEKPSAPKPAGRG